MSNRKDIMKRDIIQSIMRNEKTYRSFYKSYDPNANAVSKALKYTPLFFRSLIDAPARKRDIIEEYKNNNGNYTFVYQGGERTKINMWLPNALPDEDTVQYSILMTGHFYEEHYLDEVKSKYLKKGMTILDCGANIGNHSIYFAKICDAKKVISFEAVSSTYDILKRNIELNDLSDIVEIRNVALGDGDRNVSMDISRDNLGGSHVVENSSGNTRMVTLDESVNERVDFMKVDVEGYEYNLLKGAGRILKESRPSMMIEIKKENYSKVDSLLKRYGYIGNWQSGEDYIYSYQK